MEEEAAPLVTPVLVAVANLDPHLVAAQHPEHLRNWREEDVGRAGRVACFAMGAATSDLLQAPPEAVVSGMRVTFGVAAGLISLALAIAFAGQAISRRTSQ